MAILNIQDTIIILLVAIASLCLGAWIPDSLVQSSLIANIIYSNWMANAAEFSNTFPRLFNMIMDSVYLCGMSGLV